MRVLHYYARYLEHPSGVTDSLSHWAAATADAGFDTEIICAEPPRGAANEGARADLVRMVPHFGRSRASYYPRRLASYFRPGDLLVLHEGWVLSNAVAALAARLRRVRYIVVPHGVYEPEVVGAQRRFGGVRALVERLVLRNAAATHVFYPSERETVERFARTRLDYIVVPNGSNSPEASMRWTGDGDYFFWMGRFDVHHKGLDNLLRFWACLPSSPPRLVLAGPDFAGGRRQVAQAVEELGISDAVEIRRHVSGDEKLNLIKGCRAYLHPSRWESCSIALLEMLGTGVPCLVSGSIHAAPVLAGAGAVVSVDFSERDGDAAAQALAAVDRSEQLSRSAADWFEREGEWARLAPQYVTELVQIASRQTGAS